jgi:beta-galactosidase
MLHLCGKEFVNRDGDTTEFVVYSNLPEVTLTVDGTEYRKECPNHFFHFTVPQPKGSYTVVASAGSLSEQAQFCHVTEPDPAYRFQQGTVLNWFDITTPEGYYSVKDLLKDITQSPEAAAFINPLLAEMTASRMRKAAQKEQEAGRTTQKSGEGISAEARRNITLQFSLLQLIRMGAPDMPKERIIEINRWLNRIPKK